MGKKIYAVKEWDDKIHYFEINENQVKVLKDFKNAGLIKEVEEINRSVIKVKTDTFSSEGEKTYCIVGWDDSKYSFSLNEDQYNLLKILEEKEIFFSMFELKQ